jgi:hypothetical protein
VQLVLTDKQYENMGDTTRHLMIMGSAGSGKTIYACTKVVLYALEYPKARIRRFQTNTSFFEENCLEGDS